MADTQKFTKIVATLGPHSRDAATVEGLLRQGTDVIRLNFSHGTREDHVLSVRIVREAAQKLNRHIAIFQDLQGPKIRLGSLADKFLELATGETLVLTTDTLTGGVYQGLKKVSIDYPTLHEEVRPGDHILIDDGLIELMVERSVGHDIVTQAVNGGLLKPRKGVNLPNIKLNISAITAKDREDLSFAYEHELDYVALSFVRDAQDVQELIDFMVSTHGFKLPIITKIEKPEAFQHIAEIIDVADAIMVARGDLGVETSPQDVPLMQKAIIRQCNIAGKPVITATQMLESMIVNPRPTRAEANDVANAILDGTDAVMLSGETAVGRYPVAAVRMMDAIARRVETSDIFKTLMQEKVLISQQMKVVTRVSIRDAILYATMSLADKVGARYIIAYTNSGSTTLGLAKFRPLTPLLAFSANPAVLSRLALVWGTEPLQLDAVNSVDELFSSATAYLLTKGLAQEGDLVVFTAGVPVGVSSDTNMIKVVKVVKVESGPNN